MHMIPTFEDILIRTPANPIKTNPEATMPQTAWKAVLWDAVQDLCRPYTPEALRRWLQTTHPRAWAIGAPQASPPPPRQHTEKEKGKRKAHGKWVRRGPR